MKRVTDTDRINFFEKQCNKGSCPALVNDDNGHWAVAESGFQNVVVGKKGQDVHTTFFISAKEWKPTVRQAIDAWMKSEQ